jgi:hypothetical protein
MRLRLVLLIGLLALGGCVCGGGHYGRYGGYHPGACFVG